MEMRYENGLGLHVSIKHVNTLIKSLRLMRFIPMSMFYSYNSFYLNFHKMFYILMP